MSSSGVETASSSDGGSTVEENDDECSYEEKGHDVDSIVLTVRTTKLYHFPAMQLVSLVNHPVLVKDAYQRVCIAEFGYRLFVNISTSQKIALCTEISNSGITVKPHSSRLAFVRGRCTIGLYILIRAMVATKITNTLMIGYGMKMPYAEKSFR